MTTITTAVSGHLPTTVAAAPSVVPAFGWDQLNPVSVIANLVAVGTTSVWQGAMTDIWSAGLWLTGFVFQLVDAFTAPDLASGGLMSKIYPFTFGIGAALALILALVQVGFAAWQRDGKGLARLVVGVFQFMLVWGGMIGVGAALNVATAGLTQGMLQVAFGAPSFAKANILQQWNIRQGVDAATATVLGVCGLFLVFAAIGYLLVMLVRAAALMILMATSPISAAGLLSEGTRSWFWKSLRWFLAALMIGPLAALVLAIGKLLTDGLLSGAGESTQSAVGTAVIGTMLIIMGAFCPLILFRLLAFVDPGTSSGASFRASLDSAGGVGGLLQGGGATGGAAAGGDFRRRDQPGRQRHLTRRGGRRDEHPGAGRVRGRRRLRVRREQAVRYRQRGSHLRCRHPRRRRRRPPAAVLRFRRVQQPTAEPEPPAGPWGQQTKRPQQHRRHRRYRYRQHGRRRGQPSRVTGRVNAYARHTADPDSTSRPARRRQRRQRRWETRRRRWRWRCCGRRGGGSRWWGRRSSCGGRAMRPAHETTPAQATHDYGPALGPVSRTGVRR